MSNFGWIYLIDSEQLAEQKVRVHVEGQVIPGSGLFSAKRVISVKNVTPEALPGPGEVETLLDWIRAEMEHGRDEEGTGASMVTEFFLSYGVPGIAQVAQFERGSMMSDDLELFSQDNPVIRQRLGLGVQTIDEMYETAEKAWEAQALPTVIGLLQRLGGWFILSREDVAYLMKVFERLPEDQLCFPEEWEEVLYRHQTHPYDFMAVLWEVLL